jgi:hypothetical protein
LQVRCRREFAMTLTDDSDMAAAANAVVKAFA